MLFAVGPILFEAVRAKEPTLLTVRLTREVYSGKEYLLWATYSGTNEKPASQVTIRVKEIPGLLAALQTVTGVSSEKSTACSVVNEDLLAYIAAGKVPF